MFVVRAVTGLFGYGAASSSEAPPLELQPIQRQESPLDFLNRIKAELKESPAEILAQLTSDSDFYKRLRSALEDEPLSANERHEIYRTLHDNAKPENLPLVQALILQTAPRSEMRDTVARYIIQADLLHNEKLDLSEDESGASRAASYDLPTLAAFAYSPIGQNQFLTAMDSFTEEQLHIIVPLLTPENYTAATAYFISQHPENVESIKAFIQKTQPSKEQKEDFLACHPTAWEDALIRELSQGEAPDYSKVLSAIKDKNVFVRIPVNVIDGIRAPSPWRNFYNHLLTREDLEAVIDHLQKINRLNVLSVLPTDKRDLFSSGDQSDTDYLKILESAPRRTYAESARGEVAAPSNAGPSRTEQMMVQP